MRLPVSWLKRYVDVKLPVNKLEQALTLSGTKVEQVSPHGDDTVIHIEVTTNRPDCLSILGLAREVAALTGKKIKTPKISAAGPLKGEPVSVSVEDKKGCPRYTARIIRGVTVEAAPVAMQKELDAVGTRAINNIVDVTNFVLFEMGQPLHAFDFDKLSGGRIVVRRAKKDEKFLAIDGAEYTLDAGTLVIADRDKVVAIAGVMGGKLTEVSATTKNILLESAYFDPALVRLASKKFKLSTESSYRFERGVDAEAVAAASARARDLILETAGGKETGKFTDVNSIPKRPGKRIALDAARVNRLLGLSLKPARMVSILRSLGIPASASGKNALTAVAPSFRRDLNGEMDLAEEILRIEGFDKVPAAIPITRHSGTVAPDRKAAGVLALKKSLADLGLNEIITFSMISEKMIRDSGFTDLSFAQKIRNPLSAAQGYLRPSFLPGMLEAVLFNVHRKAESLKLFEIGNRYGGGREETVLGIALYGEWEENWLRKGPATFFDLKGIVGRVFECLKLSGIDWQDRGSQGPYEYASVAVTGNVPLAKLGLLSGEVLARWDIPRGVFYAEILLDDAFKLAASAGATRVKKLPKFPSVRRDIAFVIDASVPVKDLEEAMRTAAAPAVSSVRLFDEFKGKNIPAGKRSLAFSLHYQKDSGTFTDEEIQSLQSRVGEALKSAFKVDFR